MGRNADAGLGRVLTFKEDRLLLQITNRLERPSGLAVTSNRIYVADSYNRRVQVFQYLKEAGQ